MLKRIASFILLGAMLLLLPAGCSTPITIDETTLPTEATTEPTQATVPATTAPPATLPPETTAPTEPPYHEDITAVPMVRMMGMLYILDKEEDSLVLQLPKGYGFLGFCYEDQKNDIPQSTGNCRNIPTFTEVYASLDEPDYLYYNTGDGYQRLIRAALVENNVSKKDPDNTSPETYTTEFFKTLMRVDIKSPYCQAAGLVFNQPEGVDLYELFYNGFWEWEYFNTPITPEEEAFLSANGWGEDRYIGNAERFPVSAMDEWLQRCFGITFAQSWKVGLDRMELYNWANQCYYHWRSDTRGFPIEIMSIENEPGSNLYHVTYQIDSYLPQSLFRMTLIKTDEGLQIYSNVAIE